MGVGVRKVLMARGGGRWKRDCGELFFLMTREGEVVGDWIENATELGK